MGGREEGRGGAKADRTVSWLKKPREDGAGYKVNRPLMLQLMIIRAITINIQAFIINRCSLIIQPFISSLPIDLASSAVTVALRWSVAASPATIRFRTKKRTNGTSLCSTNSIQGHYHIITLAVRTCARTVVPGMARWTYILDSLPLAHSASVTCVVVSCAIVT